MTESNTDIRSSNTADANLSCKNALTIGNFDGCHLGHQKLIDRTLETAAKLGATPAALTFFPRPDIFFHPERAFEGSLFTESMKTRAFLEQSIQIHYTHDFSAALSQMSPDSFIKSVLLDRLHAQAIIVGENFRFGQGRAGDTEFLRINGTKHDIITIVEKSATFGDQVVSSTTIRSALRDGRINDANHLLGRPYLLEGNLAKGDQLGRTIGFPTLNLSVEHQLIPGAGVYAGYVWIKDVSSGSSAGIMSVPADVMPAAINIGLRPTIKGKSMRIEAHVLSEFSKDDCYDVHAGFYISHRIRDEKKFDGLDELRRQIAKDIEQAKRLL